MKSIKIEFTRNEKIIDLIISLIKSEVKFEFARSSGAGGQNVNKVSSKAILRWNIFESKVQEPILSILLEKWKARLTKDGELMITSEEFRDQPANKRRCMEKLEDLIRETLRSQKKRVKTKPTRSSIQKRLKSKKIHKEIKSGRKKVF